MKIRSVEERDRKEVMEILGEAMSEQYMPMMIEEFDRVVKNEYYGIVAEEDGILGYGCMRRIVETFKYETLAVKQNLRSKGVGSEITKAIIERARKSGVKVINLDTDVSDSRTVNFHMKNGFRISGYVENEYIPGVTQVHMTKEL